MKKTTYKKPTTATTAPTRKPTIERRTLPLKYSLSQDSLLDSSSSSNSKRKASTPTHEHGTRAVSPDISCILMNEAKSQKNYEQMKLLKNKERPPTALPNKPAIPREVNLEQVLDLEYTRYMQTVFKNKLEKSEASDVDELLVNVQKRIMDNQKVLQQTSERLKNITFNKEIDLLHSLHNPNYGKVLEHLDSSNCEEYLSSLQEKLDQSKNRLNIKNIEVPQGGGAQLIEVISDTLAAFENLKNNQDVETPKVLSEIKESNRSTANAILRCKDKLATAENLALTRATLEISARDKS